MELVRLILAFFIVLNTGGREMPELEFKTVTMSFVGDCTLGTQLGGSGPGTFNRYAETNEPGYFLEKVAPIFERDDFTVANCEGVLSDNPLEPADKGSDTAFWFLGPASNAKVFSSSSVEVAGFSNNHMGDYGSAGVKDTVEALEAEGLTVAKHMEPVYLERDGFTVALLACRIRQPGDERKIFKLLDEMEERSDFQVIYTHGGAEGTHTVDPWRVTGFRALIDRGADLVVGSHPHMLQPLERYNGGTIIYSLGNFCFGGNRHPENATAIYRCELLKTPWGVFSRDELIPCRVYDGPSNNYQPRPVEEDDPDYGRILDYMTGAADGPQ